MSVITISRHFGAGGRTLGEMVSKRLGYAFYDNEVIQLVSVKAKVSEEEVQFLEEDTRGAFKKLISGITPKSLHDLVLSRKHGVIDEEVYVDVLRKIIIEIADEGNAVIIGRGSQYVLEDSPDAYHVLVTGDRKDRIRFMEEKHGFTHAQAVKAVNDEEKRRANLYSKLGQTDYDQPDRYHLVLNTSMLDLESACEMVCKLVSA
jgi:cytidylate kinase